MASESRTAVVAAIVGNMAIAVTKFIAAAFTGSSAMISEGIHSLVDTGNDGLILLGIHQSKKPPDDEHPFGHGKELYFWTLIVAVMIFGVGGGMSVYEGITHLAHPNRLENPFWNYIVLGLASVFEGISWIFAWRAFNASRGDETIFSAIHTSKDPTNFTVLLEDSAALLGLLIAFFGVLLGHLLDNPQIDGAASIVIGLLLALVATLLIYETRGLLIGEGVDRQTLDAIRQLAEADEAIARVNRPLTIYFGPHDVLLTLNVQFREGISSTEITAAVIRLEERIRSHYGDINRIFIEASSLKDKQQRRPIGT